MLGQLIPDSGDRFVCELLSETFEAIDREYFQSIMADLVSRMKLIESSAVASDNPTLVGLNSKTVTGMCNIRLMVFHPFPSKHQQVN